MFLILSLFLFNSSIASPPQNLKDVYEEDGLSFGDEKEEEIKEKDVSFDEAEEEDEDEADWRSNAAPSSDENNFEDN